MFMSKRFFLEIKNIVLHVMLCTRTIVGGSFKVLPARWVFTVLFSQYAMYKNNCLDMLLSVGGLKHPPTSTYPQWLAAVTAMGIDANTNSAVGTTI